MQSTRIFSSKLSLQQEVVLQLQAYQ